MARRGYVLTSLPLLHQMTKKTPPTRQNPFFCKIFSANKAIFHETFPMKVKVRGRTFSLQNRRLSEGRLGFRPLGGHRGVLSQKGEVNF
jgi:hypothetical protein